MEKFLPYAKVVAAIVGAAITSALTVVGPDTDLFKILTVASAVITAVVVYAVPNQASDGRHEAL